MPIHSKSISSVCICLLVCSLLAAEVRAQVAPSPNDSPATIEEIILADKPAAYWRFDEGENAINRAAIEGAKPGQFEGKAVGPVTLGQPGPRSPMYPDFRSDNKAARFDGKGGYLRIEDADDAKSGLRFRKRDSITIEAWINPTGVSDQQQVYIVGKGRTDGSGKKSTNQNWSLRLRGVDGAAGISFLFRNERNRPDKNADGVNDWHRWTSEALINPTGGAAGWHHVAITYTFGKGDSIRGYIDGQAVKGAWDMGGQTDDGPVVDGDDVWIGSSLGGNAGSSYRGMIDEVAVYRAALSPERIAARYHADKPAEAPASSLALAADADVKLDGKVKVFIFEGIADQFAWPAELGKPVESFEMMDFVLAGIPHKYSDRGVRIDRSTPTLVRLAGRATVEAGEYRFLIRSLNGARLIIDGKVVATNRFINPNASGHERVPDVKDAVDPSLPQLPTGHVEKVVTVKLGKGEHTFVYDLFIGGRKLRTELGQPFAAIAKGDGKWMTLSPMRVRMSPQYGWGNGPEERERAFPGGMPFDDALWDIAEFTRADEVWTEGALARDRATAKDAPYWKSRHDLARKILAGKAPNIPAATPGYPAQNAIDHFLNGKMAAAGVKPGKKADELTLVRRGSLDVQGVIAPSNVKANMDWLDQVQPNPKRDRVVSMFGLERWADQWIPYWQDVLAENPSLVKPTLNNTGPFRQWIYESFADNKPIDRFVTELIRMEGSTLGGGPAGFAMASQNDVPMAAKANVIAKAFLGIEMKCARCHDAPNHPYAQKDLFSMAAMLERKAITVPKTSSVPGTPEHLKKMLITVTLKPGEKVEPAWSLESLAASKLPPEVLGEEAAKDPREKLAAIITSPTNPRFAKVMVNRMWKRYMGYGLVEPVDDWEDAKPSHPELLDWLAHELMTHDYDLKHVAKLILSSHAYQREVDGSLDIAKPPPPEKRLFAYQVRRRLSAEQVVDSLFAAVGKDLATETLTFDQDGRRPPSEFLNFGQPRRAWELVNMSNERDRPALALPMAQHVSDVLLAFGWRDNRPDPVTQRDEAPHALQPLMLANGPIGNRIARLSDDSSLTSYAVSDACRSPEDFVKLVFRSFLTREPTEKELKPLADSVREGFSTRVVIGAKPQAAKASYRTPVSWANHLSPEATTIKLELEKKALEGDTPTAQLTGDWRERAEDVIWAVMNMPEFLFVP